MAFKIRKRGLAANSLVVAGIAALSLAAGFAHAQQETSVVFYAIEWDLAGGTATTKANYDVIQPGAAAQTYGAPTVTSGNLFAWSAANTGAHSAYANTTPSMQTLRSSVAVSSQGGTEYNGWLRSAYQGQTVTVGAGSSGLSNGAPITLSFTLHLDGTMAVGNSSYPTGTSITLPTTYGYAASASALLSYEVFAPGSDSPTVSFQYRGDASYGYYTEPGYSILTDTFSSNGRYTTTDGATWIDLASNDAYDHSLSPVPNIAGPGGPSSSRVHAINTGLITLFMETHVGDTLMFIGSLDTEAKAWGDLKMTAMSDFGSTFDAEIKSSTLGIELIGLQAGIAPVPEPAGYAMLLAGLGLMGFIARRRRYE